MVKIRLQRTGATKQPKYRIVVASKSEKRNGKFIEIIGHYDPMVDPAKIEMKVDRYRYWLSTGARPSKAVGDLYKRLAA